MEQANTVHTDITNIIKITHLSFRTIHIVVSMNSQSTVARTPLQYGHILGGNAQRRECMAVVCVLLERLDYRVHKVPIRCIGNKDLAPFGPRSWCRARAGP